MRQIKPAPAEFEKIIAAEQQSFYWRQVACKRFSPSYHYHPEFELIHIRQGHGQRLVGDAISHFGPGDLVFIASNVPHIWQVAPECPQAETLYLQFLPDFLGLDFFKTPEMQPVLELMTTTRAGVTFSAPVRKEIAGRLHQFPALNQSERLLALLDVLCRLGQDKGIRHLGNPTDPGHLNRREEVRISQVFNYLNENLAGNVSQAAVAKSVRLSPAAFSRLFKKTTRKCFMQVVNELRIAQVCRLLAETDRTVSEIAYGCGFESLPNFHCQFRRIMKTSPGQYRHQHATFASGKS